jgi:plastocyanin
MERQTTLDWTRKLAVLLVALGAITLLAGCGDDDDESDATDTTAGGSSATSSTTAAGTEGTEVTIAEYAFSPSPLTAHVGDTVTWTNQDDFDHKVSSDTDAWEPSEDIPKDGTFEVTFDEAGTYAYHCGIHNYMTGEIVVEA